MYWGSGRNFPSLAWYHVLYNIDPTTRRNHFYPACKVTARTHLVISHHSLRPNVTIALGVMITCATRVDSNPTLERYIIYHKAAKGEREQPNNEYHASISGQVVQHGRCIFACRKWLSMASGVNLERIEEKAYSHESLMRTEWEAVEGAYTCTFRIWWNPHLIRRRGHQVSRIGYIAFCHSPLSDLLSLLLHQIEKRMRCELCQVVPSIRDICL